MYKIIGADGHQYGPVLSAQIREWIAAGRANAGTMAQMEGSADWRPLSSFAEFAYLSVQAPPPVAQAYDPRKSKLIAGLLGIFIGGLGIHRFYLGYTGIGIAQIAVTLLTCGAGHIWGLIEGILILVGSGITTDAEGQTLKEQ
jgi:TM2 domain-containing membrane protein YozV